MNLDAAHAAVASLVAQVQNQRAAHRARGGSEAEFVESFVTTFVTQARQHPGPAVLIHMAVALYSLGLATDEIVRLNDAIAMHDSLLAVLTEPTV